MIRLIEEHLHEYLTKDACEKYSVNANELLVPERFDLAFKLFYLDMINNNPKLAEYVYTEHIRALSLGTFSEPGNINKNSISSYISTVCIIILSK